MVQPGNYSYYLEKREAREAAYRVQAQAAAKAAVARRKATEAASNKSRAFPAAARRELEGMESAIMAAEEVVAGLEEKLNDPDFHASSFSEVPEAVAKLDAARDEVVRLYQRWEELETLRAESGAG